MAKHIILWVCLSGLSAGGFGQSYLVFKKNSYREVVYEVGDEISFRLKGDKSKITDKIRGFEDSLIVLTYHKINPKEISHLYVDDKTKDWYSFRFKFARIFLIAGTGYLTLDVLNSGEFDRETMIISGSLIGAGLLAKLLIGDRIRIKGKRKLSILK